MIVTQEEPALAFCEKTHESCGHACKGVTKEKRCLPCLKPACAEKSGHFEGVNEEELCTICYTCELGEEPCSQLSCGHVFHTNCLVQLLKHRWATLRISFAFMQCPSCKQEIELKKGLSKQIAAELGPLLHLKRTVEREALKNAELQGVLGDDRLKDEHDFYYNKPLEYAMHRCSFYECFKCKKPYFGGLIDCEQEMNAAEQRTTEKEDLLCQECMLSEMGVGVRKCEQHGIEFVDWKCMYCCSIATYCCWGTNYFCGPCHDIVNRVYPASPPA